MRPTIALCLLLRLVAAQTPAGSHGVVGRPTEPHARAPWRPPATAMDRLHEKHHTMLAAHFLHSGQLGPGLQLSESAAVRGAPAQTDLAREPPKVDAVRRQGGSRWGPLGDAWRPAPPAFRIASSSEHPTPRGWASGGVHAGPQ